VRIVLVDDHPLMRRGVAEVLGVADGCAVVGEAGSGAEARALVAELRPDLVLCDVNLPDCDGIDLVAELLDAQPGLRAVMLTLHSDDVHLRRAVAAGAAGFARKDRPSAALLSIIRRVAAGEEPIRELLRVPDARRASAADLRDRAATGAIGSSPLTARETEVLAAIARGLSNKELAVSLGVSDQTVKNHVTAILRKLAVNDRTQAVMLGLRRGWIALDLADDVSSDLGVPTA
jgi:DNA-binding NarL/FixJ family response regulator